MHQNGSHVNGNQIFCLVTDEKVTVELYHFLFKSRNLMSDFGSLNSEFLMACFQVFGILLLFTLAFI
jgi:hypothetical protein